MKTTHTVLALISAAALASCTATTQSPVHPASTAPTSTPTPTRSKAVPAKATPKPEGALRQVAAPTAAPKPKAFPDIPLKEDTGASLLIHTKPDSPSYKRSTP